MINCSHITLILDAQSHVTVHKLRPYKTRVGWSSVFFFKSSTCPNAINNGGYNTFSQSLSDSQINTYKNVYLSRYLY